MSRTGAPLVRSDWSAGMVQDVPRYLIPDNAIWDGIDVYINIDGAISKRGGITAALSSATTETFNTVGILNSTSADASYRGYLGGGTHFYSFAPANGTLAITQLGSGTGSASATFAPPFQYQNFLIFPAGTGAPSAQNGFSVVGGATGSKATRTAAANYTITAGSSTITGVAAGDFTNIEVGMLCVFQDAGTNVYVGRLVATNSGASTIDVEPVPTTSFTTVAANSNFYPAGNTMNELLVGASTVPQIWSVVTGCSWQNRVVLGGVAIRASASGSVTRFANRVMWSILPTETPSSGIVQGAAALTGAGFEANNYVDLPDIQQIMAVVPMQDQSLLVLGSNAICLITGTLTTQTAATTVAAFTYSVRTLTQRLGCMATRSVQQTPAGVIFATREGVCMFDGKQIRNLMEGRIQNMWKDLIAQASPITATGSATLAPAHYFVHAQGTNGGGFLCNLDGYRWTRTSGGTAIEGASCFDTASGYRVFATKYGQDSTSQSDKLYHFEQMLLPSSSNTTDATGSAAVVPVVKTKTDPTVLFSQLGARVLRAYSNPSLLKKYKHAEVTLKMVGGAATATVTATPGLDAEESSQVVLTFSPSANVQVKRAQIYNPQVLSHALAYTITTTGACNTLDLYVIETDVVPLRLSRVA